MPVTNPQPVEASPEILRRNLEAIARTSPDIARRLAGQPPRDDVLFIRADDGSISAQLPDGRWLASRRRPAEEGRRLAQRAEIREHGAIAVAGFALGHHLAPIAERVRRQGVLLVFEPDLALLRAVCERVPMHEWIESTHLVIVDRADDPGAITRSLSGLEALVAMGLQLLDHPPSSARLGAQASQFADTVARTLKALRTTIMTTLVQSPTTLRNLVMNADDYATRPGINDLEGSERGRPAIVIAAGPSLGRAMELLRDPTVRERFVLIAVQTVLRPLLAAGIRPHFVTALDHHEISARFYEGLDARSLEGVTLVAEAKVNPAVLEAFPGEIRLVGDEHLDTLLGPSLARTHARLRPGATVAHLAYELARYLGCDPVLLVGQDLSFTDGQYYAAGAAIHDVWAPELNPFRSLEMFEHERIVRQRHLLIEGRDAQGRRVYTDEQMHSYLVQFSELFERDASRGMRTIDCSAGSIAKPHTTPMDLADALASFARPAPHDTGTSFFSPEVWTSEAIDEDGARQALRERLRAVQRDARRVRTLSLKAADLLRQMRRAQQNQQRVARLIERVNQIRDEVTGLGAAWELTQFLDQPGALERARADRDIALDAQRSPVERQRAQIDRDERNVRRLAEAARMLEDMLDRGLAVIDGAPRLTRTAPGAQSSKRIARKRIGALVWADFETGALGNPRPIDEPVAGAPPTLVRTIRRVRMARRIGTIALLTPQPERARAFLHEHDLDAEIVDARMPRDRARAIASARAFAPSCWRGGIAGLTCYDEVYDPEHTALAMQELGLEATCLLGADWSLIDPTLIDAVCERHLEDPESLSFVFTQAVPGLAPLLVSRRLADDLAAQIEQAGPLASIGGVLGYVPNAGRADPIAKDCCIRIDPRLRNAQVRVIADSPQRARLLAALHQCEAGAPVADALAQALDPLASQARRLPSHLTLELCTGRLSSGERARWLHALREPAERTPMSLDLAARALTQLAEAAPDACVSLEGLGDPLQHPDFDAFIRLTRDAQIRSVHVRTDLLADPGTIDRLIASPVDVISVDLLAHHRETYRTLAGIDAFDRVRESLERLIASREAAPMPTPWIVPRITRCDEVYEELEAFYDHWISRLGACVIDPLPRPVAGRRIAPLPVPASARERLACEQITLLSDGTLVSAGKVRGNLGERTLLEVKDPRGRLVA